MTGAAASPEAISRRPVIMDSGLAGKAHAPE
jgi:hypothetical protein